MTIKKFQGRTEEEAIERARAQLGTDVVIMNIKEIRPKGILSFLKDFRKTFFAFFHKNTQGKKWQTQQFEKKTEGFAKQRGEKPCKGGAVKEESKGAQKSRVQTQRAKGTGHGKGRETEKRRQAEDKIQDHCNRPMPRCPAQKGKQLIKE